MVCFQLYLRETIEHGPFASQHCYKFAITKAEKGLYTFCNAPKAYIILVRMVTVRELPVVLHVWELPDCSSSHNIYNTNICSCATVPCV